MNLATAVILLMIIAGVGLIIRGMIRDKKSGKTCGGCSGGCSGCGGSAQCGTNHRK